MDKISLGRTFPLEQFANLKVTLESDIDVPEEFSENDRKVLRLAQLSEIEQAYYEYVKITSQFNLAKYKNVEEVIKALESFRKELFTRIKVDATESSDEEGESEELEEQGE